MILRENKYIRRAAKNKKAFVFAFLFSLVLTAACFQRFERLSVKATDEGIIFSHPKMEEAVRQGNLCVFGELSVSRRRSQPNDYQEQMWYLQNTASGFQDSTEPLKKPYIIYGETLPQTSVKVEPKSLREGIYRVNGVVVIYNREREPVTDLSFNDEFILKTDASGKLTVSSVEK